MLSLRHKALRAKPKSRLPGLKRTPLFRPSADFRRAKPKSRLPGLKPPSPSESTTSPKRAKPKSRLPGLKQSVPVRALRERGARQTQIPITGTETYQTNQSPTSWQPRARSKSRLSGSKHGICLNKRHRQYDEQRSRDLNSSRALTMTPKELLIQKIEQVPEPIIEELLDLVLLAKTRYCREQAREKPFSAFVQKLVADIPPQVLNTSPTDGAVEHDYYIYDTPKRG